MTPEFHKQLSNTLKATAEDALHLAAKKLDTDMFTLKTVERVETLDTLVRGLCKKSMVEGAVLGASAAVVSSTAATYLASLL